MRRLLVPPGAVAYNEGSLEGRWLEPKARQQLNLPEVAF